MRTGLASSARSPSPRSGESGTAGWISNPWWPILITTTRSIPQLHVELSDGLDDADTARFDIRWSELDNYSFHYVDSAGVNWRFDRHPNTHLPEAHFHPPQDATRPDVSTAAAEPSCIRVEEVSLVTRAVIAMWRAAYESGDRGRLNSSSNPP